MDSENLAQVMNLILAKDKVLDIGGWEWSFRRANAVIDHQSYVTRGVQGYSDDGVDHFKSEDWYQMDACQSWPFEDKSFDFALCSHTLEDLRDPLAVCHEMLRVAKRGYIVFPHPIVELQRNQDLNVRNEYPDMLGWWHHRWIIQYIAERNCLRFIHKNPLLILDSDIQALEWPEVKQPNFGAYWQNHFRFEELLCFTPEAYKRAILELHEGVCKNG